MRGWWEIIIGAAMLGGGLSGKLVLRGTNSSWGLAVVGGLVFVWGIVSLVMSYRKRRAAASGTSAPQDQNQPTTGAQAGQPGTITPSGPTSAPMKDSSTSSGDVKPK
jgi:hypothetical protein